MTTIRLYDRDLDLENVIRIWREIGWIEGSDDEKRALETFMDLGEARVALGEDGAESMSHWMPGTLRYVDEDLPLCAITAVMTSHVGRRLGHASSLTALALEASAEAGMAVAALGMFEQGFYDRLGFGTGAYEHQFSFDPSTLRVDRPYRTPERVSVSDWAEVHTALMGRLRQHGGITIDEPRLMEAELGWSEKPFGLGYRTDGRLTHFIWGSARGEHGPYLIGFIGYENADQLLDLLRLLRELSDQVATVKMAEPVGVQLQDLIARPIRERMRTRSSTHAVEHQAMAWWQARILDLGRCIRARSWTGPPVEFNLELSDPIDKLGSGWPGVAGTYRVTLGEASRVEPGSDNRLPTLEASVNAFSRVWLGVAPATRLAVTDALSGPKDLIQELDTVFALPTPRLGMFL